MQIAEIDNLKMHAWGDLLVQASMAHSGILLGYRVTFFCMTVLLGHYYQGQILEKYRNLHTNFKAIICREQNETLSTGSTKYLRSIVYLQFQLSIVNLQFTISTFLFLQSLPLFISIAFKLAK